MAECIDRLSNLPETIIHHIFSFFEHDETNNMMLVSRDLSHLSMNSPNLAFGAYLHHPSLSAFGFRGFLENLLSQTRHDGVGPLLGLSLSWHRVEQGGKLNCDQDLPQPGAITLPSLDTLKLKFFGFELLSPSCLGNWVSSRCFGLRKLVLHFDRCCFNQTLALDIPNLLDLEVSAPNLSYFKHNFHLKVTCPSLENLRLKNLNFKSATCIITIAGPQLRTLNVEGVNFPYRTRNTEGLIFLYGSQRHHSFSVHAPKLSFFYWKGSVIEDYVCSRDSFESLEEAVLEVRRDPKGGFNEFLKKLLHSVQHAKRLKIRHHLVRFRAEGFLVNLGRDSEIKKAENSMI